MENTDKNLLEMALVQFESFNNTHLVDAIFEGQIVAGLQAKSVIFENCHFNDITFWSGEFNDCIFMNCSFTSCNFKFFRLKEIALSKTTLTECNIKCSSLIEAPEFEQIKSSANDLHFTLAA